MEELLPFVTPVTFGRRKIRKSCLISTQVLPVRRFTKPLHNSSSDSSNFSKLNKTVFKIQNVNNKKLCPQSRSLSISFTHLLLLFNLCSLAETTFCHKQKRGKFSLIVYQKNTKLSSSKFTLCLDFGASKYHHNLFLWIQNSAANITLELTLGGFKPWQKTMKPLLVPFSSKTRWENGLQMINDWNHAPWNLCPDISDLHSSAQVSTAKLDLGEEWCKSNFPSSNWEASSPWVQINRSHGLHVLTPKKYGDTMCLCLCINNIIRINFIPSISDNSPTFTDRVSKFTHCARPLR